MTIAEQIKTAFKAEYDSGMTQQEMATRHCVTQAYIQRLLSGQRQYDGLSAKIISKMFPGATLSFHGDTVNAKNNGINNGVMGINHGSVNTETTASTEAFRDGAIRAVIGLDIPSDALLTVLKTLKDLKI